MNIIDSPEALSVALGHIGEPTLRQLLIRIARTATVSDLWPVTCIVIIDPADGVEELEQLLGFDPVTGPLGEADGEFTPWWDWQENHPGYFEVLHTTGTEFAYFLLVPDTGPDRSGLAALCRGHV